MLLETPFLYGVAAGSLSLLATVWVLSQDLHRSFGRLVVYVARSMLPGGITPKHPGQQD